MSDFKLTLRKPIKQAGGPDITVITFREPSGNECFELGMPYTTLMSKAPGSTDDDGAVIEMRDNPQIFKKWCVALADTGIENLIAMSAADTRRVFMWLSNELNPSDGPVGTEKN